jgi:hypothetical protein
MPNPIITTGDDIAIQATLTKDGAAFVIGAGDSVKARLTSINRDVAYTADVVQSSVTPGADWATANVIVKFAPADTSAITFQGRAWLELQVDDGTRNTWWIPVEIRRGGIA